MLKNVMALFYFFTIKIVLINKIISIFALYKTDVGPRIRNFNKAFSEAGWSYTQI